MSDRRIAKITIVAFVLGAYPMSAGAQQECAMGSCNIDYNKLNLTQEQTVKIQQCDHEWFQELQQTQPEIQSLQQKFRRLLSSSKPDAAEILLVQQQIEAKKSKLKLKATQTLLKKKQLLDESQKKAFDNQFQGEILKARQQGNGVDNNVQQVRWKKIWSNMQNVFNQETR
jgi:Spy/CpxP family protein refolding chaperone